ncbi:hypothetical protein NFI96_016850, partial [Prochilodus magdalenae]
QPAKSAPVTKNLGPDRQACSLPILSHPWSHLSMAFITGLPASQGNSVIMVVVDWFSKAYKCIALPVLPGRPPNNFSTMLLGSMGYHRILCLTEAPSSLASSRGPFVNSSGLQRACLLASTPDQKARQKRSIRTLNEPSVAWLRPTLPPGPSTLSRQSMPKIPYGTLPWGTQKARTAIRAATAVQKRNADRRQQPGPTFRPEQRVWLSARDLPLRVKSRKPAPRYVGPFKILRRIDPVTYRLLLSCSTRINHTFISCVISEACALMYPCSRLNLPRFPPHRWVSCLHGAAASGCSKGPWLCLVPGRLGGVWPRRALMGACPQISWTD